MTIYFCWFILISDFFSVPDESTKKEFSAKDLPNDLHAMNGMKCYIRVERPLNYECSINVLLRLGFSENRRHYKAQ